MAKKTKKKARKTAKLPSRLFLSMDNEFVNLSSKQPRLLWDTDSRGQLQTGGDLFCEEVTGKLAQLLNLKHGDVIELRLHPMANLYAAMRKEVKDSGLSTRTKAMLNRMMSQDDWD